METQKWSRLYSLIIIFTVNDKLGKYKEQKIIGISRGYKIMEKNSYFGERHETWEMVKKDYN